MTLYRQDAEIIESTNPENKAKLRIQDIRSTKNAGLITYLQAEA